VTKKARECKSGLRVSKWRRRREKAKLREWRRRRGKSEPREWRSRGRWKSVGATGRRVAKKTEVGATLRRWQRRRKSELRDVSREGDGSRSYVSGEEDGRRTYESGEGSRSYCTLRKAAGAITVAKREKEATAVVKKERKAITTTAKKRVPSLTKVTAATPTKGRNEEVDGTTCKLEMVVFQTGKLSPLDMKCLASQ
jgi:transcriptional regulator with XRE-family HTH domain